MAFLLDAKNATTVITTNPQKKYFKHGIWKLGKISVK